MTNMKSSRIVMPLALPRVIALLPRVRHARQVNLRDTGAFLPLRVTLFDFVACMTAQSGAARYELERFALRESSSCSDADRPLRGASSVPAVVSRSRSIRREDSLGGAPGAKHASRYMSSLLDQYRSDAPFRARAGARETKQTKHERPYNELPQGTVSRAMISVFAKRAAFSKARG